MKVLHLINSLNTGGAEKLLADSIPMYKTHGVDARLLLLDGRDYPFLKDFEKSHPTLVSSLSKGSVYNPMHIFRLIGYLKKYDIVHVHLFPSLYWAAFAKILSFSSTKLVFTEHNTHNRRRDNFVLGQVDRLVYGVYDKVICITDGVREQLSGHMGESQKYVVISNGVDVKKIASADAYPKKDLFPGILESDKLMIQVSAFRPQKDQATAINSLKFLPENVKLILVGDGALRAQNQELTRSLSLESRVFFAGVRTDVAQLLKTADVSVLSSHWEGFGLVAVESMAAGKPFVAANVPGLAEVVSGAGILFEKNNPQSLAAEVQKLLESDEYYTSVAAKCQARSAEYDIQVMVDNYVNLYNELL